MIYKTSLDGISEEMLSGFFVGWPNQPSPEKHLHLMKNSSKVVLAIDTEKNRVIGFITAVSDGVLSAYIPFLEVLPEYQNKGIGKELVKRMLEELDGIYMIDLMCDENLQGFYEQFSMMKSTGMIIRNFNAI